MSFTWFVAFFCIFMGYSNACPQNEQIKPCQCHHSSMVCRSIDGQDTLDGVLTRMGDSNILEFILSNSRVDHIPASILQKSRVQRLRVIDSTLSQLLDTVPSPENQLLHLELENVTLRMGLVSEQLKPLNKLQGLLIRNTEVPKVEKGISENLSREIESVVFIGTGTRSIDMAFVGKSKLESVIVSNASLTSLNRVSFPYPSNRLREMVFDGNKIESLPDNMFHLMENLRSVSLANNFITDVSENVFSEVYEQLNTLRLEGNPIRCYSSIKWLTMTDHRGKTVTGKCVEPQHLAGKNIVDLTPADFINSK